MILKKRIDNLIERLSITHNFSFYSSCLRIFVCFYLAKDILINNQFHVALFKGGDHLMQREAPWLSLFGISNQLISDNIGVFNIVYLLLIVLFFFGVGKNFVALLLFFFLDASQSLTSVILNGGDNYMKFILLYLIFLNSYEYFSMSKQRYKLTELNRLNTFLSNLAGYSICIHLCLIYFVSAMHKIHTDVWFNGVATYYTFSSERFGGTNTINQWMSKNGVLVTLTTYGTIIIELFYPVLVWFKETKLLFIFSAIALHLGIAVLMMLYDFQILFIVVQGMFISNKYWCSWFEKVKAKTWVQRILVLKEGNKSLS
ncbi:hypothetical protein SAMN04489761_4549 [Tenacibaculum sp. MAR_2009_124]|uniref:hypothetical protein n=1 Tax=Tenacibaculum sp. MAR_2009_124 TaxID=1250059 RepID=UPI000896E9D8|nr:hypothetical protein [Tenacibaculum sp. MAR_2009_124]SED18560.1 hypothetical protein SAMN04489761_4549 [Tenacibaculum sp. MAR_2009_124]